MDSIRVRCSNNCDPGAHKSNQAPEEGHPTTRPYESNGICPILGHLLARMLENFQIARFHYLDSFFFNKIKRTVESVRDGTTWIISGSEMENRTCDQFRGTRGSHVEQVWVEQLRELEKRSRGWGNKKWNRRTGWIQDVNNAKVFSCKKQLRNRQHLHISRSTFCFQTGKWDDALFSVSGYLNELP